MALTQYEAARVTVVAGGTLVQGVADGTFITCERDNDLFTSVAGTYGDVERTKNENKMGTITLTLQQTSPTNDLLSGFLEADELSSTGVFLMLIRDLQSTTLATGLKCWVNKAPSIERGNATQNVVWTIKTDNLSVFIGGNITVA